METRWRDHLKILERILNNFEEIWSLLPNSVNEYGNLPTKARGLFEVTEAPKFLFFVEVMTMILGGLFALVNNYLQKKGF